MVVGYHHFRKPPYQDSMTRCFFCPGPVFSRGAVERNNRKLEEIGEM